MMVLIAVKYMVSNSLNHRRRSRRSAFVSRTPDTSSTNDYNTNYDFTDAFYINLRKTIAFTEQIISDIKDVSKIDYAKVLRTTDPVYNGQPFHIHNPDDSWVSTPQSGFDYSAILTAALSVRTQTQVPDLNLSSLGRILQFEIDITTHDGAPVFESHGFVDESDIPPIDTWFYITTRHLYCWIPTLFIDKMQGAIDVEICGSYHWLGEIKPELSQEILNKLRLL